MLYLLDAFDTPINDNNELNQGNKEEKKAFLAKEEESIECYCSLTFAVFFLFSQKVKGVKAHLLHHDPANLFLLETPTNLSQEDIEVWCGVEG